LTILLLLFIVTHYAILRSRVQRSRSSGLKKLGHDMRYNWWTGGHTVLNLVPMLYLSYLGDLSSWKVNGEDQLVDISCTGQFTRVAVTAAVRTWSDLVCMLTSHNMSQWYVSEF